MHYASLVFEGLRVYNKKIFKLAEHTKRLFHSANIMDMKIPYSENEINIATTNDPMVAFKPVYDHWKT